VSDDNQREETLGWSETCLHRTDVKVAPRRRNEVERLFRNPE